MAYLRDFIYKKEATTFTPPKKQHEMVKKNRNLQPHLVDLQDAGHRCYKHALRAVKPSNLVKHNVRLTDERILFGPKPEIAFNLSEIRKILVIGAGKASGDMCRGLIQQVGERLPLYGHVNIPSKQDPLLIGSDIVLHHCSHPIPNETGLEGTKKILDLIKNVGSDELVLAMISGGGSSLLPSPATGLTLQDEQQVYKQLIECGAPIKEINTVRKHISSIKGGQLARAVAAKSVPLVALIISDVVGDDIPSIASGPTCPDNTTFRQALTVIEKHNLQNRVPDAVKEYLTKGIKGLATENPDEHDPLFKKVHNILIGSANNAVEYIKGYFQREQWPKIEIYNTKIEGEAKEFGATLINTIKKLTPDYQTNKPYLGAFIGSGEFTVTLRGTGVGGRNQEMLLSFLIELQKNPTALDPLDFFVLAAAFDGIEGNSTATGAFVDSSCLKKANELGLNLKKALDNNDSNTVFKALGTTLEIGQTGANINDVIVILLKNKT